MFRITRELCVFKALGTDADCYIAPVETEKGGACSHSRGRHPQNLIPDLQHAAVW